MIPLAAGLIAMADGIVTAADSSNLLCNAGFEQSTGNDEEVPMFWQGYTTAKSTGVVTRKYHRDGAKCLMMAAQGVPRAFQGLTQRIRVTAGGRYTFVANAMCSRENPLGGTAYLQLGIEWLNEQGKEICRTVSTAQGPGLSRVRWETLVVHQAKAPEGAIEAIVGIHLVEGERGGKGAVLVDDVSVTASP